MKKIKLKLNYFIIIIFLFGVTTLANAITAKDIMNTSRPVMYPDDPVQSAGGYIIFYGVLNIWTTPSGAVIIDCDPPFFEKCYTLIWYNAIPNHKTLILNDKNQTEITVTSGPFIKSGENGEQIHTFTK